MSQRPSCFYNLQRVTPITTLWNNVLKWCDKGLLPVVFHHWNLQIFQMCESHWLCHLLGTLISMTVAITVMIVRCSCQLCCSWNLQFNRCCYCLKFTINNCKRPLNSCTSKTVVDCTLEYLLNQLNKDWNCWNAFMYSNWGLDKIERSWAIHYVCF